MRPRPSPETGPDHGSKPRRDKEFIARVAQATTTPTGAGRSSCRTRDDVPQRTSHGVARTRRPYLDFKKDPAIPSVFLPSTAPEGACDYVAGDLRDAEQILDKAAMTLDFRKPVALAANRPGNSPYDVGLRFGTAIIGQCGLKAL